MSLQQTFAISLPTLRALLNYQAEHASDQELGELVDLAICDWLQRQCEPAKPAVIPGYLWKTVFLPEGTRLRTSSVLGVHYAEVVGDELTYGGQRVSPNQFVSASHGLVCNAWKAIQVLLPGELDWTPALRLRHAAAAQSIRSAKRKCAATSPPEAGARSVS